MKTMTKYFAAAAVALGAISQVFAATEGQEDASSSIAVWTFLGLCALIVVGQLLPALRSVAPKEKLAESKMAEAHATNDGSQGTPTGIPGKEE
jgi:hypothetical protein